MRKTLLVAAAALLLGACDQGEVTGPQAMDSEFAFAAEAFSTVQFGMAGVHPGRALPELARLRLLPDSIALNASQEAEIAALLEGFQETHRADLEALAALLESARAARLAGATRTEVAAILADARPLHLRLIAAHLELRADILEVLTPAQRTWIARAAFPCQPAAAPPLTAEQKALIQALYAAYREANQADIAAVRAATEAARTARRNGASREEVRALLEPVRPAMERLRLAGDQLRADIAAVLTAEQRDAGCMRPRMHHR